jgi:hypothetical protein
MAGLINLEAVEWRLILRKEKAEYAHAQALVPNVCNFRGGYITEMMKEAYQFSTATFRLSKLIHVCTMYSNNIDR